MKNKNKLEKIALDMLRSTEHDETRFSFLCGTEVLTFGFFLWEWCDDWGLEQSDTGKLLSYANSGEHGIAWIVPVEDDNIIEGYALFTGHAGAAAEDIPNFEGVFDSPGDGKSYLQRLGVIASTN